MPHPLDFTIFFFFTVLLCQDDVNESIDVCDVDFAIHIDITHQRIFGTRQNKVEQSIDVGNVHLSIKVYIIHFTQATFQGKTDRLNWISMYISALGSQRQLCGVSSLISLVINNLKWIALVPVKIDLSDSKHICLETPGILARDVHNHVIIKIRAIEHNRSNR